VLTTYGTLAREAPATLRRTTGRPRRTDAIVDSNGGSISVAGEAWLGDEAAAMCKSAEVESKPEERVWDVRASDTKQESLKAGIAAQEQPVNGVKMPGGLKSEAVEEGQELAVDHFKGVFGPAWKNEEEQELLCTAGHWATSGNACPLNMGV
jgi:hypothetical protein